MAIASRFDLNVSTNSTTLGAASPLSAPCRPLPIAARNDHFLAHCNPTPAWDSMFARFAIQDPANSNFFPMAPNLRPIRITRGQHAVFRAGRSAGDFAVAGGGKAGLAFEEMAEIGRIAKAEAVGDFLDIAGRSFQPEFCLLHHALMQELDRRAAERPLADGMQPVGRDAQFRGIIADRPVPAETGLDQLPVSLQDRPGFALPALLASLAV